MTELLTRPTRPAARGSRSPQPLPASTVTAYSLLAGAAAAGVGLLAIAVVVIVTWAASVGSGAGAADALRAVGAIWLAAHRVTVTIAGADVGILPMGLLPLPAYALLRAGQWLARATGVSDLRGAVRGGVTVGCGYAFTAAVVASLCTTRTLHPAAGQALVAGLLVGVTAATFGVLHGAGLLDQVGRRVSPRLEAVARAAGAGLLVVLAAGALVLLASLAAHGGRVGALGGALRPGSVGAVSLVLACVAYLPNGAVWAAAYAAGPGFAVGAHTSVTPFGNHLGAVPSFPLLGALPSGGAGGGAGIVLLLVPLAAGAVVAVLLLRRLEAARSGLARVEDAALWAFGSGALAGVALGVLAALSGGPAGPGRLATVGPSGWQVGLAAAGEIGASAAVTAALLTRRRLGAGVPRGEG